MAESATLSVSEPSRWARLGDPQTLQTVAHAIIVIAGGWWLLGQFATVLRPLLIAVFLGYVLMPWYSRLRRAGFPAAVTISLLTGLMAAAMVLIAVIVYANVLSLKDDSAQLQQKALEMSDHLQRVMGRMPAWMGGAPDGQRLDERLVEIVPMVLQYGVTVALTGLLESAVAGLYLLFLLLGAEHLPGRVRYAYHPRMPSEFWRLPIASTRPSLVISKRK